MILHKLQSHLQNIRVHIKNVWQINISIITLRLSAILKSNQQVSETRLLSLIVMSVLSHWLTSKPFVLSLYKCDTARMVRRLFNSTAMYTSVKHFHNNTSWMHNQVFFLNPSPPPPSIPSTSPRTLHFIIPPHIPTKKIPTYH